MAQHSRGNSKRKTSALDLDENTCFNCGVTGHKRGDAEFKQPSYFKKKQATSRRSSKQARVERPPKKLRSGRIVFSQRLQRRPTQLSHIASPGAQPDAMSVRRDPNPIMDIGCPRSVVGIQSAAALSLAFNIEFKLRPLDCAPFFHGYGMHCSEA